jgi:hypothetical protein
MSAANKGVLSTARTEEGPKILTPQNKKTENCAAEIVKFYQMIKSKG